MAGQSRQDRPWGVVERGAMERGVAPPGSHALCPPVRPLRATMTSRLSHDAFRATSLRPRTGAPRRHGRDGAGRNEKWRGERHGRSTTEHGGTRQKDGVWQNEGWWGEREANGSAELTSMKASVTITASVCSNYCCCDKRLHYHYVPMPQLSLLQLLCVLMLVNTLVTSLSARSPLCRHAVALGCRSATSPPDDDILSVATARQLRLRPATVRPVRRRAAVPPHE